jgi:putative SOS response-associated peptidase YedK
VASKPAFRDAWARGQHCIIPAEAFWEPDRRSGKNIWTRITQSGGNPLGHRPSEEKRMIVILREEDYDAWLDAPAERSMAFMRQCPPQNLEPVAVQ